MQITKDFDHSKLSVDEKIELAKALWFSVDAQAKAELLSLPVERILEIDQEVAAGDVFAIWVATRLTVQPAK